ncbi:MAG: hypothetical protein Q7T36_03250 [Fluviicoccus sp.]|uniref:hypothetical protein n=1 Tax=Fluviicoccus sp. TaxID=2003552 RepID=UPI00271EC64C|nr:hypothetical protein [Fluviicoccus sp.]MDO8329464.1 hypothetical protein [Fluviicoccus sp.]
MLLDRYESDLLFFNVNFKESAATSGRAAYRGELVLKEGEIADAQGRRRPPEELLKEAVLLAEGDKLLFMAGLLDELQFFPSLLDKFGPDLLPESVLFFFTVNIDKPFIADANGTKVVFAPLVQGLVWNELLDLVALEKGDFKGLGAADKVIRLYDAFRDNTFRYPAGTVEEALKTTTATKRETHGAI